MRVAVAIATTGRAPVVRETINRIGRQTRPPDVMVVVGADPADVQGLAEIPSIEIGLAEKGLCLQRNRALDMLAGRADVVVFFDDDFVPSRSFLARIERLFTEHPDIVAATGEMLADGILTAGISFQEADALIARYEQAEEEDYRIQDTEGAYGCNMVFRLAAAEGVRFDVNLPLYGWQEDIDFTSQLSKRGRVVQTTCFAGVHLGVKSGRTSGKRLGYSQIANPLYLTRKGTLRRSTAFRLASRNIMANLFKTLRPEPWVDRRGRLWGNIIGLRDAAFGRADPRRILQL